MIMDRTYLQIGVASLALCIVLGIQINWLFKTAAVKETLFSEKANMVLNKTTEALYADLKTCRRIDEQIDENAPKGVVQNLGKEEARILDSLFQYYMGLYNMQIDYTFAVTKNTNSQEHVQGFNNFIYYDPLSHIPPHPSIELQLHFPDKKQLILAEMGPLFIASIVLIIIVLLLFWRTTMQLLKEKQLAAQTKDFLNNMTHEFKTPLTNIGLATKMLQKQTSSPKAEQYTNIILTENKKLNLHVEQILGMTALERGDVPLQKAAVDIHQLLEQLLACFQLRLETANGKITTKMLAQRATINADKTQLSNALSNLLDNAIKYANGQPNITIQTSNTDNHLAIKLIDQGIGIPANYQQQVFDTFFRVPTGNIHNVKGFGIGLAYVKKIIALHQGTIALTSTVGHGTTFTITLPYER